MSPALAGGFLTAVPPGKPKMKHFRKDFPMGHVNTPLGDSTWKPSRREFERGVGWECGWPKAPLDIQVSDHILKQHAGLFRQ